MHLKIDSKPQLGLIPNIGLRFHIIGIGGIGMSAIAEVLHAQGLYVQGSDLNDSDNIKRLQNIGVKCYIGHNACQIEKSDIVAYSSAIDKQNIEYVSALSLKKTIMSRHQLLREIILNTWNICISGMHGKTTTTSIISLIFEYAKQEFIAIVGGVMQYNKSNSIIHPNARWAIIEADESDDSFIKIPTTVAIITNISPEHLDYHLTFESIEEKFLQFLENIPYYGFGAVCIDDKSVEKMVKQLGSNTNTYSYSIHNEDANFFVKNIQIVENNKISFDVFVNQNFFDNFTINIFGEFNVSNCLAAIAVSFQLGIDKNIVKKALFDFRSTKRRFEIIGSFKGAVVIDDYAHHPKEIDVVLKTARDLADFKKSKLYVIFQPHRYSRIQKLHDSFIEVFSRHRLENLIFLPIYSSGEGIIQNITSKNLAKAISDKVIVCKFDIAEIIRNFSNLEAEDVVIFLGPGDVTKLAHQLVEL